MNTPNSNICGLIAYFDTPKSLFNAAKKVKEKGFEHWDVFTPFPMHGLDRVMGLKRSKVPCFTLVGGICGFLTGALTVWYMNAYNYPLIVGGKPFFSPIFPFPVFYELTILFAAFATLFGMFFTNKLPRHHHPIFEALGFEKVSDDSFCIYLDKHDPLFDEKGSIGFLTELNGTNIQLIYE